MSSLKKEIKLYKVEQTNLKLLQYFGDSLDINVFDFLYKQTMGNTSY